MQLNSKVAKSDFITIILLFNKIQSKTMSLDDHPSFITVCLGILYNVFRRIWQAKFAYGGSILSSSKFLLLPQQSQNLKKVKNDLPKLVKHTVS